MTTIYCDIETTKLGQDLYRHECRVCGRPRELPGATYLRPCLGSDAPPFVPPPQPPSIFKRLPRFTLAAIKHVAARSPTCTQEQIDARLAICRACPGDEAAPQGYWLPDAENPELGACANCGCSMGRDEKFLNKLAWADQECPIAAWPKVTQGK